MTVAQISQRCGFNSNITFTRILKVDCKKVELLKGIMPKAQYKGKQAQEQCAIEQRFLKAIINDDTQTYRLMRDNGTLSKYFLFYTTQSPRIEITPLMVAIVFDSSQVFQLILADSGQEKRFSLKKPFYNINRVMSDDHRALGAFKLGNVIYNAHGVNAYFLNKIKSTMIATSAPPTMKKLKASLPTTTASSFTIPMQMQYIAIVPKSLC